MMRRRRGPSLLRTAAVVGTATAVSGNVAHSQQQKFAAQEAARQQAAAPVATPQMASPNLNDQFAQLEKLGQLKDQGILTQEEFDAKKRQILGL